MNNYKLSWIIILIIFAQNAQAQGFLNKIKKRVEQVAVDKAVNKAGNVVGRGIEKAVDQTGPAKSGDQNTNTEKAGDKAEIQGSENELINTYRKYDFVPGESVFYANDFEKENLGEIPAGWNSNGNTVLVGLDKIPGNWLHIMQRSACLTDNNKGFGENFTVEFDLLMQFDFKGWLPPSFTFGLLSTGKDVSTANRYLNQQGDKKAVEMQLDALSDGANLSLESFEKNIRYFHTQPVKNSALQYWFGKVVHVAIQGQNERLRIWMNGEKLYDVPKAIPVAEVFNNVYFKLGSSPYQDSQIGFYVRNLKFARGLPDLRRRLLEEGEFSTTGILFDANKALIRPESAGVLKEIADVLAKNPELNIKIIGHTDSDGDEKHNQKLSEERALNIKLDLEENYRIAANRMTTAGKGEAEPVADNSRKEGKAQNRRVEFKRHPR